MWPVTGAQWAVLSAELGLASYPAPIRITTRVRGEAALARVRGELEDTGLMRSGRVEADLEAALRQLHRPDVWLDSMWLPDPARDEPARLVAARNGGATGVCATQYPGQAGATTLEIIPIGALVSKVIGALPAQRAGRMPAVTVAPDTSPHQDDTSGGVLLTGNPGGRRGVNARVAAAAILDAPHPRAGQIAVNVRGHNGTVRRSTLLRWYDNQGDGRYQAAPSPRSGALEVGPTDAQRLGTTAQHMLATLIVGS